MARTILLTGGCGFIGSNFIRFVLEHRDETIINLDALTYSGNPENLADVADHDRYRFVHGDINDAELLASLIAESDAIVHMAAESHVDRSINDPRPFIDTNVVGTQTVLESARRTERDVRVLYVSTDEVYGALPLDDPSKLFTETSPIAPNSPYAASKAAGDLLARAYHHTFGLDVVTTRCSNNFGPYQFPEKVIPLFVTNLMQGEKVPLYGDGLNVRDWLHVDDHCEAILRVLDDAKPGSVYNIGGNNERSNLDLTHAILDAMGCDHSMITPVADRPGHDRRYAIDASKIKADLGWQPSRSAWPEALRDTILWYQDNEPWWRRIRSGEYRTWYQTNYASREG